MADLTSFTDVNVKSEDSLREFLDFNAIAHETIYNTLLGQFQIEVEHYPLFTMAGADKDWLFIHDREHKAIANALNLGLSPDLDTVNFKNQAESEDWLNNHADMHALINQVLGL